MDTMHTLPACPQATTLLRAALYLAGLTLALPASAQQVGASEAGKPASLVESPDAGAIRANPTDELEYSWVPAGTFQMGCVPDDTECDEDEKPRHAVTLSTGF